MSQLAQDLLDLVTMTPKEGKRLTDFAFLL